MTGIYTIADWLSVEFNTLKGKEREFSGLMANINYVLV
jgi:hypothetical protein